MQDRVLRQRLQDSERKLGLSMPIDEAQQRAAQLQAEVSSLERLCQSDENIFVLVSFDRMDSYFLAVSNLFCRLLSPVLKLNSIVSSRSMHLSSHCLMLLQAFH